MKRLLQAISGLAPWQKLVVAGMAILVFLTWLAICLVLTGYVGP
jgi:hypothetical protein